MKSGNIIEDKVLKRGKGYGRGGTYVVEKKQLSGTVFFPENPDGTINLRRWCLTENEALFFEAVDRDEILQQLDKQIEECYEKKRERWNFFRDKFGVDRKHQTEIEGED